MSRPSPHSSSTYKRPTCTLLAVMTAEIARGRAMSDDIREEVPAAKNPPDESSVKLGRLPLDSSVLKIYQTGELTVVGFGGQDVPDEVCIAAYRTQLLDLISQCNCKVMAFDLTGVKYVPSGMLGVLASIRKRVERVELYNPSADVMEVLRITRFDRLFEIKEISI